MCQSLGGLLMDAVRQALPNWCDCHGATRYHKHQHTFGEGPKTITRHLLNKPWGGCGGRLKCYNPIPEVKGALEPLGGSLCIIKPKPKSPLRLPWPPRTHQLPWPSARPLLPSDTYFFSLSLSFPVHAIARRPRVKSETFVVLEGLYS